MRDNIKSKLITFSILMANYNNAKYIKEAIKSVISQTYPHWELIIVDDVSTDNSIEKIKPYLKDNRIKLILHEKNIGYGGALKTAADNASNMILAVLDADDKLHENALKIMSEVYKNNPKYGFIYSTYWICDSNMQNPQIAKKVGPVDSQKTNLHGTNVSHFKTFQRDFYIKTKGYDPTQKRAVDKDIIFKMEEVTRFKFINKPLYYYRWHGKGLTQEKNRFLAELYHYIAKVKAYRRRVDTEIPNLTRKEIYFEYYRIMFYKLTHFLIYFYRLFKISNLIDIILNKIHLVPENVKIKFKFIKKLN